MQLQAKGHQGCQQPPERREQSWSSFSLIYTLQAYLCLQHFTKNILIQVSTGSHIAKYNVHPSFWSISQQRLALWITPTILKSVSCHNTEFSWFPFSLTMDLVFCIDSSSVLPLKNSILRVLPYILNLYTYLRCCHTPWSPSVFVYWWFPNLCLEKICNLITYFYLLQSLIITPLHTYVFN